MLFRQNEYLFCFTDILFRDNGKQNVSTDGMSSDRFPWIGGGDVFKIAEKGENWSHGLHFKDSWEKKSRFESYSEVHTGTNSGSKFAVKSGNL